MKTLTITVVFIIGFLIGAGIVYSQSLSAPARGVTSTQVVATCPTPVTGTTWYCETFTGPFVSLNGAAYIPVPLSVATGNITGITVNGGVVLTGPTVALTIPTKATSSTTTTIQ